MSILLDADKLVCGERQEQYADPVVNFTLISKLSTLMTGKPLTARDCCLVMMAVKLSREAYKHKTDNLIDLAGYTEILERIESQKGLCKNSTMGGICRPSKKMCSNCDEFKLLEERRKNVK